MTKKPAHDVVLKWLHVHIRAAQTSVNDLPSQLVHNSAIQVLCEVLQEMIIPEEDRLRVANQLMEKGIEYGSKDPESDLVKLLFKTLSKIEEPG